MPASLRFANDFTLAAWYRATAVDDNGNPSGAGIISGGNIYILRLRPTQIEFSRSIGSAPVQCKANTPGFLDGQWHHVAAVASRTGGTRVYYDGVQACFLSDTDDVGYGSNPSSLGLYVGRHGNGETQWDFGGHIDEVRIYTRALSATEVGVLAQGRNL